MKVNMTPNPLDVVTIHASQGDTEARQWEFELHNNGELIDTSEITEQLFFKAYKGGTEQILPENTSTPTTSPFIGDIKYPQGLLTDQEFLYRQSPTEEDGLAKITDIKGNTLVWNQLVQNGNFATDTKWGIIGGSKTVANNSLTITANDTNPYLVQTTSNIKADHKYLIMFDATCSIRQQFTFHVAWSSGNFVSTDYAEANIRTKMFAFLTPTVTPTAFNIYMSATTVGATAKLENVQIFDLTLMELDTLTVNEFISLFPLPYYDYNQGSLLSFNGNGIKTVGFNQWDEEWEHGSLDNVGENTGSSASPEIRTTNYIPIVPNESYYLQTPVVVVVHYYGTADLNDYKGNEYLGGAKILNIPSGTRFIRFRTIGSYGDYKNDICLNISNPSKNGTYEPYTSSTLSLPISTYFPTGMKSAGTVYDELTPTRAITRIGAVDLGSLNWTNDVANRFYSAGIANVIKRPNDASEYAEGLICAIYTPSSSPINEKSQMQTIAKYTNGNIYVLDDRYSNDATAFKNSLSGVYLYYELATPLENYGIVDLGSLTWYSEGTNTSGIIRMGSTGIRDFVKKPTSGSVRANIVCDLYATETADRTYLKNTGISINTGGAICVYDPNYNTSDKIASFKQAMSGVYLLYEKENSEGFTTASLVTENAEIPLSNEDGILIGKCTEQLSSESGFFNAKIKLADEDGECYSNKIQLHVERKPS